MARNGKAQDKNYEMKTDKTVPGINETRSEKIKLKNLYTNLSNENRPQSNKIRDEKGKIFTDSNEIQKICR